MIIGLDKGASAVKIASVEGEKVLYTKSIIECDKSEGEILREFTCENGISLNEVSLIALTGVGAEKCNFNGFEKRVTTVSEIEATGEGGSWLSKLDEAIVVSIGTGTSLALAKNGKYSHIGGSGVGSGTIRGISRKMFCISDLCEFFRMAEKGNRLNVDLTIKDLFTGTDTLPPELTASNLAKCLDGASESDWAYAIINTVLEVAGSHAALACKGYNVKNVVITGGISQTNIAKHVYKNFTKLYKLNYVIPEYSGYATAIGAARRALNEI